MDKFTVFPNATIKASGPISGKFLSLGINVPMLHCFLVYGKNRVDLTEGNNNGKKRSLEDFLYTKKVIPNISGKNEYLLYRKALSDYILIKNELKGIDLRILLKAREEGLTLLKANIR